jgi:hypothetical protein
MVKVVEKKVNGDKYYDMEGAIKKTNWTVLPLGPRYR